MKINIKMSFLIGFLFCFQQSHTEKHVIGSWSAGFFSAFFGVLNHLYWCEKTGKTPVVYWGKESFYWQNGGYNGSFNAWDYFFEPVSYERASPDESRDTSYSVGERIFPTVPTSLEKRLLAHRLINSYIKIVPSINHKVESFFTQNMAKKRTIGIHLRGTDKYKEVKVVDPILIFEKANREAILLGDCQFFVATDEYRLLELAQKTLNRPVIYHPCERSKNSQPLWAFEHKAIWGEDILIEALLLSHCDIFLHTISNISVAVLCFNPLLKNILFT